MLLIDSVKWELRIDHWVGRMEIICYLNTHRLLVCKKQSIWLEWAEEKMEVKKKNNGITFLSSLAIKGIRKMEWLVEGSEGSGWWWYHYLYADGNNSVGESWRWAGNEFWGIFSPYFTIPIFVDKDLAIQEVKWVIQNHTAS